MYKVIYFLFISSIAIIGCKNSQKAVKEEINIDELIIAQIGAEYQKLDRGELALCFSYSLESTWKKVLVVNVNNGKILFGPENLNANVSWFSDREILIRETPEVIEDKQSSETYNYIYNLDSQIKRKQTL